MYKSKKSSQNELGDWLSNVGLLGTKIKLACEFDKMLLHIQLSVGRGGNYIKFNFFERKGVSPAIFYLFRTEPKIPCILIFFIARETIACWLPHTSSSVWDKQN